MTSPLNIVAIAIQLVLVPSVGALSDPAGQWEPTGPTKEWAAIASSADGASLAAAGGVDGLWRSSNRGTSWVDVTPSTWNSDTHGGFVSITSSGDGKVIGAGTLQGHVFVSVNSGVTWIDRLQTSVHITSIASSESGAKLVATQGKGNIWRSTDFGQSWKEITNIPVSRDAPFGEVGDGTGGKWWMSITSSADGVKLTALTFRGSLWTSLDSGATWTESMPISHPPPEWRRVCSSSSGNNIVVIGRGVIYVSRDTGATWSDKTPAAASPTANWHGITSSSNGKVLAATIWNINPGLWISVDGGDTWTENPHVSPNQWLDITSSALGPVAMITSGGPASIWIPATLEPHIVDFENGLTSGGLTFTMISGNIGQQPTTYDAAKDSSNPQGGGRGLFRTDFDGDRKVGDLQRCAYHSSAFRLRPGDITFDVAGRGGFIALCLVEDASNCRIKRPTRESTTMIRERAFKAEHLKEWSGRRVFFKLVDDQSGSWGHLAIDNIAFHGEADALPSNRNVVDFETGLKSGGLTFTKVSGDLGQQPTSYAPSSDSINPQGGQKLFRTDFDGDTRVGDRPQGSYHSSVFKLKPGDITFDYAGHGGFIALCLATDPSSCRTHRPSLESTTMQRGSFTAVELESWLEQRVFFKLVDDQSGSWGHLAIDNIVFHGVAARRL